VRAKANVLDTIVKYPDVSCLVGLRSTFRRTTPAWTRK
jgi:hypothetical protein